MRWPRDREPTGALLEPTGDSVGLVALSRTPPPGCVAALRQRGFRVIKQKRAYDATAVFVEPFAAVLVDRVTPALTLSDVKSVLDALCALPEEDRRERLALFVTTVALSRNGLRRSELAALLGFSGLFAEEHAEDAPSGSLVEPVALR